MMELLLVILLYASLACNLVFCVCTSTSSGLLGARVPRQASEDAAQWSARARRWTYAYVLLGVLLSTFSLTVGALVYRILPSSKDAPHPSVSSYAPWLRRAVIVAAIDMAIEVLIVGTWTSYLHVVDMGQVDAAAADDDEARARQQKLVNRWAWDLGAADRDMVGCDSVHEFVVHAGRSEPSFGVRLRNVWYRVGTLLFLLFVLNFGFITSVVLRVVGVPAGEYSVQGAARNSVTVELTAMYACTALEVVLGVVKVGATSGMRMDRDFDENGRMLDNEMMWHLIYWCAMIIPFTIHLAAQVLLVGAAQDLLDMDLVHVLLVWAVMCAGMVNTALSLDGYFAVWQAWRGSDAVVALRRMLRVELPVEDDP